MRADSSVGSASASSRPLQWSDCVPPSTAASACKRDTDDVVVRLLRGERAAGGLGVEAQLLRAWLGGAESIAHQTCPQPPRGPELGDFLEKIVVRVEEEREPLTEAIDVEPGVEGRLHVGQRVGERERDLLDRGRSGFADVIAADRDRVPVRQLAIAVGEDVGDDSERGAWRIDVGAARDVLFEDVVLDRARRAPWPARPACARPRRRGRAG